MKKFIIVSFVLLSLMFSFGYSYSETSSSIILGSQIEKEKVNYQIISFIYESELSNTAEGTKYITVVNAIVEKFKNDENTLTKLKNNTDKILLSEEKNSVDDTLVNMFALLNAKVSVGLLDFQEDKAVEVLINSEKTDNFGTGSISSSGSTNNSGSIIVQNENQDYSFIYNPKLTYESKDNKISLELLNEIKKYSFSKGTNNTKYSWLEFNDMECPYCAKLHNDGTYNELRNKNPNINYYFFHFPLESHENALVAAEVLECLGQQKGDIGFFSLMDKIFKDGEISEEYLINEAQRYGARRDELLTCLENGDFTNKIKSQVEVGEKLFNIAGTPNIVIMNNYTGEFQVITGAYPLSHFEETIERLK